jgi:uncharacterized protein YutE (UPF0331/DUF86 family)
VVDAERLATLLARVVDRVRILRGFAEVDVDELVADRVRMDSVKYTFQTAVEACIDAAHHTTASEGLERPATNAGAFLALAGAGLLPEELGPAMADAVGFRNLLVHQYAEIDDRRVVAHLGELDVLDRFVDAMTGLIG